MQTTRAVTYEGLTGWAADDHAAALTVFRATMTSLTAPDWREMRAAVDVATDARAFFEQWAVPLMVGPETFFYGIFRA